MKIRKIDDADQAVLSPANNRKRKTRRSNVFDPFEVLPQPELILEEGEWPDSSTLNEEEPGKGRNGASESKENYNPGRLTKAEKKRARHSYLVEVIPPGLMDTIDITLHPGNNPFDDKENKEGGLWNSLKSNQVLEDNIRFNTNCFNPASMRQSVHSKRLLKSNGVGRRPSSKNGQMIPEITSILEQLGITPTPFHASKERSALVKQLRSAIKDDIEKIENENRDTMMRMAGYWRYVNRKTYNFMVRQNRIWDWATGQKLEEVEDDNESELDGEDVPDANGACWDDSSTVGTPFSGAGTPQNEVEDSTPDHDLGGIMKDLRLVDNITASEAKPEVEVKGQASKPAIEKDYTLTPKVDRFPSDVAESKTKIPAPISRTLDSSLPGPFWDSFRKNTDHPPPVPSSTHKTDGPPDVQVSPPSAPAAPPLDKLYFSIPHHDPNNPYNPLTMLSGGHIPRQCRAKKSSKLGPRASTPLGDTTNTWMPSRGKRSDASRASYASVTKENR